jgi:hypothetical protein
MLFNSLPEEVIGTDFLFIFPKLLGWLRGLEPWVTRLPLGAQYQVLCRKPQALVPHQQTKSSAIL